MLGVGFVLAPIIVILLYRQSCFSFVLLPLCHQSNQHNLWAADSPMHSHQTFSSLGAPGGAEGVHSKIVEAGRQSKNINIRSCFLRVHSHRMISITVAHAKTFTSNPESGGAWQRIYSSSRRPTMNDASMLIVRCVRCRSSITTSHGGLELFTTF